MGERDRIDWSDWDADDGGGTRRPRGSDGARRGSGRVDSNDASGRPTRRAQLTLALVLAAAFLITIVLCCVAAGEAGQLLKVELPPP